MNTSNAMFYVEKQDSQPRVYELTDTVPAPTGPYRRYITKFEQTPAFIVHSKMHGTHEKAQPYVVRGVSKRGTLLVQATVATEYDPIGRWHEVECGDTTEGYRFKRYLLKPMAALIKLGTDTAKANARSAKKQAQQADRDEKCGACPACFGDYVVTHKLDSRQFARYAMVHHGYERPGDGMIHGDCYGVGYEPYEVSCEGTRKYLAVVQSSLKLRQEQLAGLAKLTTVQYQTGRGSYQNRGQYGRQVWVPEYATAEKGTREFVREVASRRVELEGFIAGLERHIEFLTDKINTWKPQTFPRVVKKGKAS